MSTDWDEVVLAREPKRGRGRPSTGTRIDVRVPADVLATIDASAALIGVTRAELVRMVLVNWAGEPDRD